MKKPAPDTERADFVAHCNDLLAHKTGCTGKRAYEHRHEAREAATSIRRSHNLGATPEVYRCKHCLAWHMSTQGRYSVARIKREQAAREAEKAPA